ncbi:MAG: L-aspartate oxidase [Firmicutes bacterium]|nr:L-aspartate oxidase [Bacillota bacterium]
MVYDVIVVGSGIAGLYAAYKAADYGTVCVLTKARFNETNTWFAQGGIAAAIADDDSPAEHMLDTLAAGAGACNPAAVAVLVEEGPACVRELLALGTPFDQESGHVALTREGAHHKNRILHCGGDATGRFIQQTLQDKMTTLATVTMREYTFVTELLLDHGIVCGVRTLEGECIFAAAVILATGGLGQVYARTTNPAVATGDGVAMAYRAGADVADMEFVQFHPTVFHGSDEKETFLISEAVRGEGAYLRNKQGERFMLDVDPMAELGSRDVVARAIVAQMKQQDFAPVWLDATHVGDTFLQKRFPTIYQEAKSRGYELAQDWLPVSPAAHYVMGGIVSGLHGETSLAGLYACGEVACSGVHGANRLASNSLLEGLVFAKRAVNHISKRGKIPSIRVCQETKIATSDTSIDLLTLRGVVRERMFMDAGVVRSGDALAALLSELCTLDQVLVGSANQNLWEVKNMVTVARLITNGALCRTESRGGHYRVDRPEVNPQLAAKKYIQNVRGDGFHAFAAV